MTKGWHLSIDCYDFINVMGGIGNDGEIECHTGY
jgi:hypothetical protein